jgi:hypothetical protein
MSVALGRIDDMHGTIAGGKAIRNEREQNLIELIVVVEECARMTTAADLPAGEIDCSGRCLQRNLQQRIIVQKSGNEGLTFIGKASYLRLRRLFSVR